MSSTTRSLTPRLRALTARPAGRLAVPLVAVVLLAGCGGSSPAPVSTAPVLVPGTPGGAATTIAPGDPVPTVSPGLTAADVAFVAGMIPHHEQALELAGLAPGRAENPSVLGLASRISDVQGAEIDAYERWLTGHGLADDGGPLARRDAGHEGHADDPTGGMAGMDHGAMGMTSEADVERLTAARGAEFDRLWLELMINHHEGAIAMANTRDNDGGQDETARQMAADVVADQLAEIRRMLQVLETLKK